MVLRDIFNDEGEFREMFFKDTFAAIKWKWNGLSELIQEFKFEKCQISLSLRMKPYHGDTFSVLVRCLSTRIFN